MHFFLKKWKIKKKCHTIFESVLEHILYTFYQCFYDRLWTGKCSLGTLLIYIPQVTVICTRICLLRYPGTVQSWE